MRGSRGRTSAGLWALRILLLLAGLAAPWLLVELYLLATGYEPPELRTRLALFPSFPAFYEPDRELGWKLKPNLDWTGTELVAPFHTDAHGNRRNPFLAAERLPSTVDAIGDSTTFGFGSTDGQTYPAALQRLLNKDRQGGRTIVVRNLGVPGYSSVEARLIAERDGHHAPVSLILVGFIDHFASIRPRIPSLWMRRVGYTCFESRACSAVFDWTTWRDPELPAPTPRPPTTYVPDVPEDRFVYELTRAVRALRERGSEPILLVYPPLAVTEEVIEGAAKNFNQPEELVRATVATHPRYQELTREVARAEKVRMVDLHPIFEAGGNEKLHLDWVHPNADGLSLMATSVADVVKDVLAEQGRAVAPAATAPVRSPGS
jgi:lysophospholipase L1-like esterase